MKSKNVTIIDNKDIGQRIREEREKLALTRADLAELIELSDYYVGQLERGERQMSLPVLIKITSCLHVSMDYLVLGKSNNNEYTIHDSTTSVYTNERERNDELYDLLDKCSQHELSLIKKLVQTILPYI
ncbi:MAG: helix-turn-helix transcriptional regulator [Clostridiales bacterium]|nr:helix-turn-helix transcriptional regulator [Clostridiales bacterium]